MFDIDIETDIQMLYNFTIWSLHRRVRRDRLRDMLEGDACVQDATLVQIVEHVRKRRLGDAVSCKFIDCQFWHLGL